jgi:hypothetical protein
MNLTEFTALIREEKTKTNSTTFPDSRILRLANIFKNEICSKIVARNAGYFLVPVVFDLVAGQREYKFPDDMIDRMHKLELKFDLTSARFPSTYLKDYKGSETESEIVKNFGNNERQFLHTIRRRAVFILSGTIPNVVGGGRFLYYAYPPDWTTLTGSTDMSVDPSITTFGFPIGFHELLARRISIEWKSGQTKPVTLSRHELNYENDLKLALDAIASPDESGEIIGNSLPAEDTGHNGWDY